MVELGGAICLAPDGRESSRQQSGRPDAQLGHQQDLWVVPSGGEIFNLPTKQAYDGQPSYSPRSIHCLPTTRRPRLRKPIAYPSRSMIDERQNPRTTIFDPGCWISSGRTMAKPSSSSTGSRTFPPCSKVDVDSASIQRVSGTPSVNPSTAHEREPRVYLSAVETPSNYTSQKRLQRNQGVTAFNRELSVL